MRQKTFGIIEHLTLMSMKQGVCVAEFFQALVSAREHGESVCQGLSIEYRGSLRRDAIFLVTKQCTVVGQFRVAEELLARKDIHFETWVDTERMRWQKNKQKLEAPHLMFIQDLRHGMKRVNIDAEVLETSAPSRICTPYGNSATITDVMVGDETGRVKLCLWNGEATFFKTGDTVQIRNAKVSTYKGERQLHVGKGGIVGVLSNAK